MKNYLSQTNIYVKFVHFSICKYLSALTTGGIQYSNSQIIYPTNVILLSGMTDAHFLFRCFTFQKQVRHRLLKPFLLSFTRIAEIPCVIVTGMNKNAGYQIGQKMQRELVTAQWNVVLVDGQWRFIDVFWASTCLVGSVSKDWILVDEEGV